MTGERHYGKIMLEAFARAIPWAIVFSFAIVITAKILVNVALSDAIYPKIKQNTKEAIEYTVRTMDSKLVQPYNKRK